MVKNHHKIIIDFSPLMSFSIGAYIKKKFPEKRKYISSYFCNIPSKT